MCGQAKRFHLVVAAILAIFPAAPATAGETGMDGLFAELAQTGGEGWKAAESDILREWSRSGSAVADLLLQRGEVALDSGDPVGAIGHLTALTEQAPAFPEAYAMRAAAFYAQGAFGPAFEDIAMTLKLEPRHWLALTQLGAMFEEMSQTGAAMTAYRRSLAINPHQQDAADALARLTRARDGTAL